MRTYRATVVHILSALALAMSYELTSAAPSSVAGPCVADSYCAPSDLIYVPSPDGSCNSFGRAVAMEAGVAIVGAPKALPHGAAYVYRMVSGQWSLEATLRRADGGGVKLGEAVATDGAVAVVADSSDSDGFCPGVACGAVYVFRFNGTTWDEEARLVASDRDREDFFGSSVAIREDVIVVGAYNSLHSAPISHLGTAYVFRRVSGSWVQEQRLTAWAPQQGENFAKSVATNSDFVAVGSRDRVIPGSIHQVYIFRFNGAAWEPAQLLTRPVPNEGHGFGEAVAMEYDVLAVGAPKERDYTGAVYVFRNSSGNWGFEQKLAASDLPYFGNIGYSVAIDGALIVAGGRFEPCESGGDCGSAYLFEFDGAQWNDVARMLPTEQQTSNQFGEGVAVDAGIVFIGTPRYGWIPSPAIPQDACGAVFVFTLDQTAVDCDCDGQADACEFNYGTTSDCNDNAHPDGCDITDGTSADCDGDGVPDECEPDCNVNSLPDDCDIADRTSEDCEGNGVPDECQSTTDCNNNGVQDFCDVATGASSDCNNDIVPDECQLASNDCNGNLIPDDCESPVDCNSNAIRDFCDIATGASEDCNSNAVPDECDIDSATSTDANNNGSPDECDTNLPPFIIEQPVDVTVCGAETVVFAVLAGGMTPFTYQWRKDTVDLDGETADTLTLTGVTSADSGDYDVVVTNELGSIISDQASLALATLGDTLPDPTGVPKNRYLSFIPSPLPCTTAIRVRLISLQHPVPPNNPPFPPRDYSAYEFGSGCTDPSGCVRWVGNPGTFLETQDNPRLGNFRGARLQCTPYYHDFSAEGLIHVTGAEIVPSSTYTVEMVDDACMGIEDTCDFVSAPLTMTTGRSGDVATPFQGPSPAPLTQPDVLDVVQLVSKFHNVLNAPVKVIAQLQPNLPELNTDMNVLDILACVDAFRGNAYAFSGPCPCPSTVPCGPGTGSVACPGGVVTPCVTAFGAGAMCVKTCTGGANDGDPCVSRFHCPDGICDKECVGGANSGNSCFDSNNCGTCTGGSRDGLLCFAYGCPGGTCSTFSCAVVTNTAFCRDRCGRCTP